jgi:hypothetical protein
VVDYQQFFNRFLMVPAPEAGPHTEGALSQQQRLHQKAKTHLSALEEIIDQLKAAGPCPLDDDNAILNIRERLADLSRRCTPPV